LHQEIMKGLLCFAGLLSTVSAGSISRLEDSVSRGEDKRAFPIFSIVKFKNDECDAGSDRKGTCYTREECDSRGGNAGNSCAEGFGICCEFRLVGETKCGQSVAQNNTYIVEEGRTDTGSCTYEICPCSTDICRIRFEFTTLQLANPVLGTTAATNALDMIGDSIGTCQTDTFMITGVAASSNSPIICGPNNGQHMILDSDGKSCHKVNIMVGAATTPSRQWDIRVLQYDCSDLDNTAAGPRGCLQYFHEPQGNTANGWLVNYGANAYPQDTAVGGAGNLGATTTHLANQNYNMCIRRMGSNCRICYAPQDGTVDDPTDQVGFGLSATMDNTMPAKSEVDSICTTDYLVIPGLQAKGNANFNPVKDSVTRVCGRDLNTAEANVNTNGGTFCSRQLPFVVGVVFDGSEVAGAIAMNADDNELAKAPGGIVGFRLRFDQDNNNCQ